MSSIQSKGFKASYILLLFNAPRSQPATNSIISDNLPKSFLGELGVKKAAQEIGEIIVKAFFPRDRLDGKRESGHKHVLLEPEYRTRRSYQRRRFPRRRQRQEGTLRMFQMR
ncbi:hypothetical protein HPP92_024739 [Vanilla planifolia]|uniref:Uncharacterized protein n=1 Tax=Vanilla planifolia TaxID=51239 RepID=A0A835PPV2_VANPL|nr:hypothetical protein HPP92_024739 [Vanilla planifolia]